MVKNIKVAFVSGKETPTHLLEWEKLIKTTDCLEIAVNPNGIVPEEVNSIAAQTIGGISKAEIKGFKRPDFNNTQLFTFIPDFVETKKHGKRNLRAGKNLYLALSPVKNGVEATQMLADDILSILNEDFKKRDFTEMSFKD